MDDLPNPPTPSKKSFSWIFIILFLISSGLAGWFYYQNLKLKQQVALIAEAPNPQISPTTIILNSSPSPAPSNSSLPQLPIVVFEPPLSGNDYATQRAEIQKKIINPIIDYYKHFENSYLVSLTIQLQNSKSLKDQYPYNLSGIRSDGGTNNEALMQDEGTLSWWTPTCMGPCDYSEEFKQKYPQIVSITNP